MQARRHFHGAVVAAFLAAAASGAAGGAESAANPSSPAGRAEALRADRQQAQAREAAFRAEQTDAQWSRAAAASLRYAVNAVGARSLTLRTLECRSRTCRVEVVPDGTVDLNEVLPRVLMDAASVLTTLMVDSPDADGNDTAKVLYFSR